MNLTNALVLVFEQLLGRSSGFTVAPTHRPCTKGLWMWSSPLKRTAPDGSEYSLLLLDSEGIDAYDQTVSYLSELGDSFVLRLNQACEYDTNAYRVAYCSRTSGAHRFLLVVLSPQKVPLTVSSLYV